MYDVYHIASETNATIIDTGDIRDPNSLSSASHSRGEGRTETRQTKTLNHFKWSFFFVFLDQVCLLLSSMAVLCHVPYGCRNLYIIHIYNIRRRVYAFDNSHILTIKFKYI